MTAYSELIKRFGRMLTLQSVEDVRYRQLFLRMLQQAIAEPERSIGSFKVLSPSERGEILDGWNATAQAVPAASVPELLAMQAARTPSAVALVFERGTLSYAALDAQANQLAHHLRSLGVGPGVMVGLCVERSPEMVVGMHGILKAGGVYLPLDPSYPAERLAFMVSDAGAAVLVSKTDLLAQLALPSNACKVLLDADGPAIARQPKSAPALDLHPHDPAYVIYTSGPPGLRRAL